MTPVEKEEILTFLHGNPMATISTIHHESGAPGSALIAFAETPDFEIIFQTLNDARKYANLKSDSRVSLVTGWKVEKREQITFQYEGNVRELENGSSEYKKYRTIFEEKKTPCTSEFLDNPKSRIFVVTPIWLSYSDYSQETPRIVEEYF